MSRPKYYWYGIVKKMIMNQDSVLKDRTLQARLFEQALEDANSITRSKVNGSERMKAIDEILISKTKTIDGVALEMNYSHWTIQNWIIAYVNLVGKKAGF